MSNLNKTVLFLLFLFFNNLEAIAQNFPMEVIHYSGSPEKMVNMVLMGDGYTLDQQVKFMEDVKENIQGMFLQEPWKSYSDKINVFAIKVSSNVSGAANRPSEPIDNYFGSSFFTANIERLLYPTRIDRVIGVLNANTPFFDIGVVIVNDSRYGGAGGAFATFSTHPDALEIMIHELGHTFTNLADEYWAGDQFAREVANMTQDADPATIRWRNFLDRNDVGIFPYEESTSWFRPHQNCKMRFLGRDFCNVCLNELRLKIENVTTPLPLQSPVAFFGADHLEVFENQEVQFFDLSSQSPSDWLWEFDGGLPENRNIQNPKIKYPDEGIFQVSLRATNSIGASQLTRGQYITVKKDTDPPMVRVRDVVVDLDRFGVGSVSVDEIDNGTTDNVGIKELSLSKTVFDCSDVGANEVIFKAIDVNGNETSRSVTVTVRDRFPPVALTKDFNLVLDEDGKGRIQIADIDDGSFDNCGIESMTLSKTEFGREDSGENVVLLTVIDVNGNESTATAIVRVDLVLFTPNEKSGIVTLYPNPSQGYVYIDFQKSIDTELQYIEVLGANGVSLRTFYEFPNSGNLIPLDITELSNGLYFLRLYSTKGVHHLKFTIQK